MKIEIYGNFKNVELKGSFDSETREVVINAGSTYSKDVTNSFYKHLLNLRQEILKKYCKNGVVIKNISFKSASTAAGVLCGSSINGIDFFKDIKTGKTLKELAGNGRNIRVCKEEKEIQKHPWIKLDKTKKNRRKYWAGKKVLEESGYTCFMGSEHKTFKTDQGTDYMEAHHLIPFKYQKLFDYDIQVPANIVCLCPKCHRELHYGKRRFQILKELYDQRSDALEEAKIGVKFEDLCRFYKLKRK